MLLSGTPGTKEECSTTEDLGVGCPAKPLEMLLSGTPGTKKIPYGNNVIAISENSSVQSL